MLEAVVNNGFDVVINYWDKLLSRFSGLTTAYGLKRLRYWSEGGFCPGGIMSWIRCAPPSGRSVLAACSCENCRSIITVPSANNADIAATSASPSSLWFAATIVAANASVLSSELSRANISLSAQRGMASDEWSCTSLVDAPQYQPVRGRRLQHKYSVTVNCELLGCCGRFATAVCSAVQQKLTFLKLVF